MYFVRPRVLACKHASAKGCVGAMQERAPGRREQYTWKHAHQRPPYRYCMCTRGEVLPHNRALQMCLGMRIWQKSRLCTYARRACGMQICHVAPLEACTYVRVLAHQLHGKKHRLVRRAPQVEAPLKTSNWCGTQHQSQEPSLSDHDPFGHLNHLFCTPAGSSASLVATETIRSLQPASLSITWQSRLPYLKGSMCAPDIPIHTPGSNLEPGHPCKDIM